MFGKAIIGALRVPGAEHLSTQWAPGPYIHMFDASGRERASLSVVSGDLGSTSFAVADGSGSAEASLRVDKGAARMELSEQGKFRTLLGRTQVGGLQGIVLFDKDGGVVWRAP
jgi:hypothetical protein